MPCQVRRLGEGVICGYAGATADALTLVERLERKLEQHPGMSLCVYVFAVRWGRRPVAGAVQGN